MKLNHLNLCVPDVQATATFFEEFFGFRRLEAKGRDALVLLADDAGFILNVTNFDPSTVPKYPRDFHIGFFVDEKAEVEAIHARLAAAGHVSRPPHSVHGFWGFYFHAPGGIQVEVSCPA